MSPGKQVGEDEGYLQKPSLAQEQGTRESSHDI